MKNKFILDVTCGGRTIWFDKKHPNTLYVDNRKEEKGFIKDRLDFEVNPDQIMDFRDLKFKDKSFKLVIFDPPHLKSLSKKSWIYKKYGSLDPKSWKSDINKGFSECYRVLEDYGTLIIKWSTSADINRTRDISVSQLLEILPVKPLFGHTSGSKSNTMWICFMKIPGQEYQTNLKWKK